MIKFYANGDIPDAIASQGKYLEVSQIIYWMPNQYKKRTKYTFILVINIW